MNIRCFTLESLGRTPIYLGKAGEGNRYALRFETAKWLEAYPNAQILLYVIPPEGAPYLADLKKDSGDVIWTITDADTAAEGKGKIELVLHDTATDTTIKSVTGETLVFSSPSQQEPEEPPEPHRPWWEKALQLIASGGTGEGGSSVELDTTLKVAGKAADAGAVGTALNGLNEANAKQDERLTELEQTAPSGTSGLTVAQVNALNGMFKVAAYIKADVSAEYEAFKTAFGIEDSGSTEPDEPDTPEVTLTSVSATYSGGDVTVGTSLDDLTGITVTAHYSDGSTATVTGYTLSGSIAEGANTITVSYGGLSASFTVTGVAESSGDDPVNLLDGVEWIAERVTSDGNVYQQENWNSSQFLPVTASDTLRVQAVDTHMFHATIAFYDSNKAAVGGGTSNYLNHSSNPNGNYIEATVPGDAAFARVCLGGDSVPNAIMYVV